MVRVFALCSRSPGFNSQHGTRLVFIMMHELRRRRAEGQKLEVNFNYIAGYLSFIDTLNTGQRRSPKLPFLTQQLLLPRCPLRHQT